MRGIRAIALTALLFGALPADAAPDYKYCEIAGLAFGSNKDFVGSVAARIVDRQGLTGEAGCQAVWQDAYKTGQRLSAGGHWTTLDSVKWRKLQDFETRVLDSVINGLQLGV